jgi:hypothetical protein
MHYATTTKISTGGGSRRAHAQTLPKKCMTQLKKFLRKMEEVTQTASYWETGIALLEMNHIRTLLDHMD